MLMMKLACLVLTIAPPCSKPFMPACSMRLPALSAGGLRKKQPEIKQSNQLQKAFPVQKHLSGETKFIVYAVVFLIFVLETILLLPFAVVYGRLGFFAFVEVCIFSFIMLLGLFYALRKNVLRWK